VMRKQAVTVRFPVARIAPTNNILMCSKWTWRTAARIQQSEATTRQAMSARERPLLAESSFQAYAACRYFFKDRNGYSPAKGDELEELLRRALIGLDAHFTELHPKLRADDGRADDARIRRL